MADDAAAPLFEFEGHWPFDGTVRIAGHETLSVSSFTVTAAADGIPVVKLTLVGAGALRLLLDAGAADLQLPDETHEALLALGWTPPAS